MKKVTILLVFIGLVNILYAQKDPEAEKILKELSNKTKAYTTIQLEFTIDFKNIRENIENSSNGTITMKGDMYRLNFMGTTSYFNGKTLWNYVEEVNEVNITEPAQDEEDIFSNPRKLFTIYEKGYKYQLINKSSENGINYSIIDLYPEDLTEEYAKIRLQINTDDITIKSATIFGKDGSNYSIKMNKYSLNKIVDDSYFVFNEKDFKNVEIIDMRF